MAPAAASPQTLGSDELRVHTQHYIPATGLTIQTQVELVEIPVVVRDRKHQVVPGLTQSDFAIYDQGKKQEIVAFTVEKFTPAAGTSLPTPGATPTAPTAPKAATPPRFVALCFDDLALDPSSMMRAKAAARQFVKTSLAPGDRVAVVTTAWLKNTAFTDDVPAMLALIDKVGPNSRMSDDASMDCPSIRPYEAYLLANNRDSGLLAAKVAEYRACAQNPPKPEDTIIALSRGIWERAMSNSKDTLRAIDTLVQSLTKAPGRRMILLASSGFLSGDLEIEEDELITRALHAGVVINALGARGLYTIIPGGEAAAPRRNTRTPQGMIAEARIQSSSESAKDDGMAVLASGTGGAFFHDNNDLLRGFRELGMVPEAMYILGFSPSDATPNGRFHNLKVRLNPRGYTVQARMGYNALPKPTPAKSSLASKVDDRMNATDTLTDLPAKLTWTPDTQKAGVTFFAEVDVSHLKFETRDNRRVQVLTVVAALRDENGKMIAGDRSDVELNLTDATFNNFVAAGGLRLLLTVKAPAGTYSARGLLLEGLEGKMATSSRQLQIQ